MNIDEKIKELKEEISLIQCGDPIYPEKMNELRLLLAEKQTSNLSN